MIAARAAAGLCALLAVSLSDAVGAETAAPPQVSPPAVGAVPSALAITWDRAANIREAAQRIGLIQRTRGAEAAMKHVDACYRTHGLGSAYSAAFEGCIAQDYLESKLLARVYSRMPAEQLRRSGAPTAEVIGQAMGRRLVAAFNQYKIGTVDAQTIKSEIDMHGLPVFLKTVFPNSAAEIDALGGKLDETDKAKEKN